MWIQGHVGLQRHVDLVGALCDLSAAPRARAMDARSTLKRRPPRGHEGSKNIICNISQQRGPDCSLVLVRTLVPFWEREDGVVVDQDEVARLDRLHKNEYREWRQAYAAAYEIPLEQLPLDKRKENGDRVEDAEWKLQGSRM